MNVQSIRNKMDEIECLIIQKNCDMLLLVETWLSEYESGLYNINGYQAFHSCREKRGGGASIYLKKGIKYKELGKSDPGDNLSWLSVSLTNFDVNISVMYRPPSYNYNCFMNALEDIMHKYQKKHVLVGDFNLNLLEPDNYLIMDYTNNITLNNYTINNDINIENDTRSTIITNSLIDHVLVSQLLAPQCKTTIESNSLSDHKRLEITLSINSKNGTQKVTHTTKGIYHKKLKDMVERTVANANIETFNDLINVIHTSKNECEYTKQIRCHNNNTWVTQELMEMIKKRDKLYKNMCSDRNNTLVTNEFKKIKNQINNKIKSLKDRHFKTKWFEANGDPRKQWSFINTLMGKQRRDTAIDSVILNNHSIEDPAEIANALNKHFCDIGKSIVSEINSSVPDGNVLNFSEMTCDNSIFVSITDENEIRDIMLNLKKNSAPGDDQITICDILNIKESIIKILVKLTNRVLLSGQFPEELKIGKISPIYKSGPRDCMSNYRPITVISTFSKIVETVIKNRMLSFISKYIGMDQYQYGFIKNSSTLGATSDLVSRIANDMDNKKIVVAVFIDLKKAFDVVSPEILLNKLKNLGFRGQMYDLIKTYLKDRKQYVKLNLLTSETEICEYGVPQGSVLGPLLYSLYVLSLKCSGLQGRYYTFADDTVLLYSGEGVGDLERNVNDDLHLYTSWLDYNKLKVNIDKTKYMVFKQKNKHIQELNIRIKDTSISRVNKIKYLGLIIDENLNWQEHINMITSKTASMVAAVYRCRDYLSYRAKMNVYNAFFLSNFRYLLPVWGTCGQVRFNSMQLLQNKILKVLFKYDYLYHTDDLYRELAVFRLDVLLKIEQSKLMYRIINNTQKCTTKISFNRDIHMYNTRVKNNIHQNCVSSGVGLNSPIARAISVYNGLPDSIKQIKRYPKFVNVVRNHFT